MIPSRDSATTLRLLGQGRILEAVAYGEVLTGTLDRLGQEFELAPDELRICLRELVRARWIDVQTQPFGRLSIRLERRSREAPPPVTGDRRRSMRNAWDL